MGKAIPKKTPAGAKSARGVVSSPAQAARGADTVLVAVTGMSPAIITETVWALAHEKPVIIPDRVMVVTTARGAVDLKAQIVDSGVWAQLRKIGRAHV